MAGTTYGGLKAKEKNLKRDPDWYKKIGAMGGKSGKGELKGFANDYVVGKDGLTNRQRAKIAGSRGGRISKRTKKNEL